ncbi:uncharacterized protein THITE_113928 [Thermothielavioides terrestris NRRL 8126]|uniref:Uncharacterized protein n=1 Tax=Thermothielavioides terrestris (strain ATCC 38088 / NRRL 8126) TaxID=578455 RepID=G2RBT2_THETT|nr:uncharacterized protein THITE_113928 [Thermothielavioides terrestris NRRL 8126]AEO69253.1 hypothetical protein THITE_113928 [Thermothielavioides terrestris NRRL 8126]
MPSLRRAEQAIGAGHSEGDGWVTSGMAPGDGWAGPAVRIFLFTAMTVMPSGVPLPSKFAVRALEVQVVGCSTNMPARKACRHSFLRCSSYHSENGERSLLTLVRTNRCSKRASTNLQAFHCWGPITTKCGKGPATNPPQSSAERLLAVHTLPYVPRQQGAARGTDEKSLYLKLSTTVDLPGWPILPALVWPPARRGRTKPSSEFDRFPASRPMPFFWRPQ